MSRAKLCPHTRKSAVNLSVEGFDTSLEKDPGKSLANCRGSTELELCLHVGQRTKPDRKLRAWDRCLKGKFSKFAKLLKLSKGVQPE